VLLLLLLLLVDGRLDRDGFTVRAKKKELKQRM